MNARALIPLIAGLGIGGLALKLGLDFVRRAKGAETADVQVCVAQQDIPRWVTVEKEMLKGVTFPVKSVPQGAFADKDKLVGRVLRMAAPGGLPILESMLLPPGARPGLVVPEGYRAVAVKIDEGSGVDYHLQPGCRVDVIGYFSLRKGGETQMVAQTILENVEVGAVGTQLSPVSPTAEEQAAKKDSRRQKKVRAVTLFVKPEKAPLLHMAEQRGEIKLAMRGDKEGASSDKRFSVTWDELLGGKRPANKLATGEPGGVLGGLMSMFAKSQAQTTPLAEPTLPDPGAAGRAPLAPAWVMRIWNGREMRLLGWRGIDSIEAIDLTQTAQRPAAGANEHTKGSKLSATVQAEDHVGEPEDPEPEELNE